MSTYAQDAIDVDAAFREDGQLITLTRQMPGGYLGGKVVAGTPVIETAWGIETGVTSRDLGLGNAPGTLVQAGDRKLMISTLQDGGAALSEPKIGDLATAGGKVYTLKNVDKLSPGGVVVMWTLIGRA